MTEDGDEVYLNKKITLFVCDDQAMFREGLKVSFSIDPYFQVVGEAANGEEALEKIDILKPAVALVDLAMPTMNGLTLAKLTSNQIDGYLLKSDGREFLTSAIHSVLNGDKYFSSSVAMGFYELLANKEQRRIRQIPHKKSF